MTSPWWLLLPFLIGLLTGWWAWAGRKRAETETVAHAEPKAAAAPTPAATSEPVAAPEPEPIAAPEPEPAPAPVAAAAPVAGAAGLTGIGIAAARGEPDDLTKINGIGPALKELLNSLGVTRFDQISEWTGGDVAKVDDHLGAFKGRIDRDNWIEQARLLATGQLDEWQSRFGYKSKE
ncbi:MAG: hypothetical protein R3D89_10190 [Sphingomonadaceae bacterium]